MKTEGEETPKIGRRRRHGNC